MACLPAGRPCIHHLSQRLAQHSSHRHSSPSWCSSTARRQGGRARNSNRRVAVRVQAPESAVPRSSSNGTPAAAAAAPAAAAAAAATPPPTSWWASQHDASILALALPAALALAADPLLSMVDTALVGRLGGDELAALGVNTSLFTLSFVLFNFLATATTPLLSKAMGTRNRQAAGEIVWQATGLALLLGTGVGLGLWRYGDAALELMGADGSQGQRMHDLALQYLLLRASAAPAVLLVTVGQGVFRGLQNMRAPLLVTAGTNALHGLLDVVLMFQLGWGIRGAAVSTAASEWLAAAAYVWLVWQRRDVLGLWPPPPRVPLRQLRARLAPFLQAGGAVVMRTGSLLGTKTLAAAVATRLGPTSVASHQVLMQLWVLSSMLVDALAVSGQTLIAVHLGQGRPGTARQIGERLLQLGCGLGLGLALVSGVTAAWWPQLFTADDSILGEIHALVPLAVLPLPINALVYTLDGVLVGASDFGYLMTAMVAASAVSASMLLMVEPSGSGLQGVWASLIFLMVGRLATLGWRFQDSKGPLPPGSVQLQLQQEQAQLAGEQGVSSSDGSDAQQHGSSSQLAAAQVTAPLLLLNNTVVGDGLRLKRQQQQQQQAAAASSSRDDDGP